jgi:hypothetical protein
MEISVTEFLRPDGEQIVLNLEIPDRLDLEDKYNALIASGCRITMEYIDGDYFIVIEDNVVQSDFIVKIVPAGTRITMGLIAAIDSYGVLDHAFWRNAVEAEMSDEPPF